MTKIAQLKEFFKKFFWKIGRNPLPTFFILILLAVILGVAIFYQYSFLAEKKEPQIIEKPLQFKEDLYQKILEEWQIRQEKFDKADSKEYRDLFKVSSPAE